MSAATSHRRWVDRLALQRDEFGQLQLTNTGPVTLRIAYGNVLGTGGQGVVFRGSLVMSVNQVLVMEVAVKVSRMVADPTNRLRDEAEMHAQAWTRLGHVLRPVGFLSAHEATDTPAALVTEIGVPFFDFLQRAGPLGSRSLYWHRGIASVVYQLLHFIVHADAERLMHKDIKMKNMYVRNSHDLSRVELAVGDFGGAQVGTVEAGGAVTYRAGVYTWKHTSPRMASVIYNAMAADGTVAEDIKLNRQLCFYNDLFGWAQLAFAALADRTAPDILHGPSAQDYHAVPILGQGAILDAFHHLLRFAMELMTVGSLDDIVSGEYVSSLGWYQALPGMLASPPFS